MTITLDLSQKSSSSQLVSAEISNMQWHFLDGKAERISPCRMQNGKLPSHDPDKLVVKSFHLHRGDGTNVAQKEYRRLFRPHQYAHDCCVVCVVNMGKSTTQTWYVC